MAASVFAAILAGRVGLKRFRCAVAVAICWLVSYLCACVVKLIETDFKVFDCGYNIRCFIFIPLAALVASVILKQKYTTLCDLLACAICLHHGIASLGCIFTGCCYGYPTKIGFYSPQTNIVHFPVQLIEFLFSICLCLILSWLLLKKGAKKHGLLLPVFLTAFSIGRFFIEFLKMSNTSASGDIRPLQIHMIFLFGMGISSLAYAVTLNKELSNRYATQAHTARKNNKRKK